MAIIAAILASLAAIVGFTVGGVTAGFNVLSTLFNAMPDKMKHIVFGGMMIGGGLIWIEIVNALEFKLLFFGLDLTLAPLAVALVLAFSAVSIEVFQWYNYWVK